ncbi:MAG: DnaA regulatory inactivator Hda [Candidatus Polarisedimenticolaceae bacterium]|nr:DnaA regulatory inactivator Hda [Candidatus Polarisedimenticolaceae bacterium]
MIKEQLPLGFKTQHQVNFDTLITGPNSQPIAALRACANAQGEQFSFICGASGCGKSHLLQATIAQADENSLSALYLPMSEINQLDPEILLGLEQLSLICLDDIQLAAGSADWEEALFHLFNRLRERNCTLIVSANQPPSRLNIQLADLASRLTWGPCYQLQPLDELDQQQALIEAAERRGITLNGDTARYLLQRLPRDMHSLMDLIDWLDHHSLAAQRKLTIPFVREIMQGWQR